MPRFLIIFGFALILIGLAWPYLARLGLGRLPGDIMFQHGTTTIYIPLTTSILASLVLSLVLWLFNR
jgi:hypothetical protein